ncbi:unnamed protein product [Moneuplotes crassus]|uniref:Uncharacterized protein n=1 Tax=Euplotes crassus TaxID=5936 RepID=A0AAD1Y9G7_EUPCR|nr:unnamed protein product [Moneuplotes crassus]
MSRETCQDPLCLKKSIKRGILCAHVLISKLVIDHAETGDATMIDELKNFEKCRIDFLDGINYLSDKLEDCRKYHDLSMYNFYKDKDETQAEGTLNLKPGVDKSSCSHSTYLKHTIINCIDALHEEFFELLYAHEETGDDTMIDQRKIFEFQRCSYLKMLGDVAKKCKGNPSVFSLRLD